MSKLYTCDNCGYALLTESVVGHRLPLIWFPATGWKYGDPEIVFPYECGNKNDCFRRRRDKVAGRRVLRNIDRRRERSMPNLY